MSCVVGLPNISYKPLTNTRGLASGFVNYKKGCTRLAATNDKAYQLLVHGRWFSPSTSAFFITKTGRHDIAEILLKRAASGDVTSGYAWSDHLDPPPILLCSCPYTTVGHSFL
jgi:hypothetical protein